MRAAILALLLTGCATDHLQTSANTVPMPVPVLEHCIDEADIPVVPSTNAVPNGTMRQDAAAASADARQLRQYAREADAALRKCATTTQGARK